MFSLLNPLFFYVMGSVGFLVPMILHLIQSRQTVKVPFSTLRFLLLAQEKSSVQIRLENILLWLIRTALLVFLALAFAMPLLRTEGQIGKWWGKSPHDVAIVIDASYSMGYDLGRNTVWEKAIKTAVAVIEGLGEQDKFCIFIARDNVEPLIGQLSGDKEDGIARVNALKLSQASCQLAPAVMEANAALIESESPNRDREIHVITDMQALPWKDFEVAAGGKKVDSGKSGADDKSEKDKKAEDKKDKEYKKKDKKDKKDGEPEEKEAVSANIWDPKKIDEKLTTVFITLLGVEAPENISPVSVELEPPLIMADAPVSAKVRLVHTGPAKSTTVTMEIDDKEMGTRSVSVGAGGAPEAKFAVPGLAVGPHKVKLKIPDDNLMIDNEFHLVINAKDQFPTVCVGTKDDTLFLRTALNAITSGGSVESDWLDPTSISKDRLAKYSCVFLCNALPLGGTAVTDLKSFIEEGGVVVVFPGNNALPPDYKAVSFLPAFPGEIEYLSMGQRKKVLHWDVKDNRVLENLDLGTATLSVVIKQGLAIKKLEEKAERIIQHGDTSFLVGIPYGLGYVLLFEVSADRTWSDFPLSPFFLPIIHQIVSFSAGVGLSAPFVWCTENLSISRYLPEITPDTVLTSPDGQPVKIRSATYGADTSLYVENLTTAGIYTYIEPGKNAPTPGLAVNMQRNESALESIPQESIIGLLGLENVKLARDEEELQEHIKDTRIGRTFGEQLLWLVLILAAIEFFLANRLCQEAPSLTDRLGIDVSGKLPAVSLSGDAGGE